MADVPEAVWDPEKAAERGYYGHEVDPTPNENYSLQTPPDAPTPETDADAKKAAVERREAIVQRLSRGGETTAETETTTKTETASSSSSSSSSES